MQPRSAPAPCSILNVSPSSSHKPVASSNDSIQHIHIPSIKLLMQRIQLGPGSLRLLRHEAAGTLQPTTACSKAPFELGPPEEEGMMVL
jgi:hypothetical protein